MKKPQASTIMGTSKNPARVLRVSFILFVLLSVCVYGDLPILSKDIGNIALDELWQLFLEYPDSETKADILVALGMRGKGNQSITGKINNYLMELNTSFNFGMSVDYLMVSASITAIMELDDSSSYPVLFAVLYSGYPEVITSEASGALNFINGNLKQFLSVVIERNTPMEKYIAFKTGINSERLGASERGQLASLSLEQALASDRENVDLTAMRYAAVLELTSLGWTSACPLAVRHYYSVREDFLKNAVSKNRFIEAVTCLGAVGDSQAAVILGLQLGLINERTERTGIFDEEITLAIVQALGQIGYNAVFDQLLDVNNLSYPEYIKIAAREAVDRLKW